MQKLFEMLFGCAHKRLSRPMSLPTKPGTPHGQTYVVCLDCGKHLAYDMQTMQLGKPLD
jgi:hypothetical protein